MTTDQPAATIAEMATRITEWVTSQFHTNGAYLAWYEDQNAHVRQALNLVAGVLERIDDQGWTSDQVEITYSLTGIRNQIEMLYVAYVITDVTLPDTVRGAVPDVVVPGIGRSTEVGMTDTELDMLLHANPWD